MVLRYRLEAFLTMLCLALICSMPAALARENGAPSAATPEAVPPVNDIVQQLELKNQERASELLSFEGTRIYRMHYEGFFSTRDAEMVVGVKSIGNEREFTIESQTGSKFIIDHIFKKLLEGEKESVTEAHRRRTALNADNYEFTLADFDANSESPAYVLNVVPKTDDKFLYRGKIWVDPKDFAVIRIAAEPAKSPSIWIKKSEINHTYQKVEDFWLPAENRTDSSIRFGGHALLSIEYKDYRITETSAQGLSGSR